MIKLEVLGIIVALLAAIGTPVVALGYERFQQARTVNEFTLVGSNAYWTPDTIRVKQGEKVRLHLTSGDVAHGFSIPQLGISEQLYPGKFKTIEFTADQPGTYRFACTILCSPNHGSMFGQLIVEPTAGTAPASPPIAEPSASATPTSQRPATPASDPLLGKTVFANNCAACHGVNAEGGVGPNLKERKPAIAVLKQTVRSGSANRIMPPFTASQVSDVDLDNLVAYLLSIGAAKE
ncbi:MAG: cupredoxin domain-containing protein [Chloroflexi bacterium]|nr:cupredoxin domain-containing protein [Chloroflexota bacterium]